MRIGPAVVCVFVVLLAGCASSNSGSGGGTAGGGPIVNNSPTAVAGGPYTGTSGTAVSFSAAGSSDPQGQTLTYAWNFGDSLAGTGASPTHTYATAGTYTVSLTVTDTSGLSGTATGKATIAAAPLADVALTGSVMSGAQPVMGAHVYLFAAGTTGYGGAGLAPSASNASVSLLSAARTGTVDANGAYVLSGTNGQFSLTGDYSCVSGQQLYLYALGGTEGSTANAAIGMLAAVGACPASTASAISATVNEVSTIAAAYALAGFATDATHVGSSGTALAQVGIANAFANAGNLTTLSTGVALATTPAGNGTVPQAEINTLANVLAGCVNASSASASASATLFADAESGGSTGTVATDTATAAINIAHNPGTSAGLYALGSRAAIYAPTLTVAPTDWTVGVSFSNDGLASSVAIAIDGAGNVWVINSDQQTFSPVPNVTELTNLGAPLSGANGFTGGGLNGPAGIAIDESNNAWVTNPRGQSIVKISPAGVFLSGSTGYSAGGSSNLGSIAIDPAGNAWIANGNSVLEMSSSGSLLTGSSGYSSGVSGAFLLGIAIDPSGNVWLPNKSGNELLELSGSGASLSGSGGYTGGLSAPIAVAIDSSGSVWVLDSTTKNTVNKFSSTGSSLSGTFGFPFGTNGLQLLPSAIAIDGGGDVWVATYSIGVIEELSNSGSVISSGWYGGYAPDESNAGGIAVDGSGNVWLSNLFGGPVVELVGAAVPVVTPISVGVKNNMLGTRP